MGPLFPVHAHPMFIGPVGLAGCVLTGLLGGVLSAILTSAVYAAEDIFFKLPIHWMWWPAIGGLFVGIGGLIFPPALGVGYPNIGMLLQGNAPLHFILGILIVKSAIWAISLGSGTSGGVLAPLLMIGAALGGVEGLFLPHFGDGFWQLVSMGATLAGTMRSPFTGILFAVELTHDYNMLLPLLVASFLAHGLSTLVLKRSILTEKVARRGYHLTREYAIDPLEILFVREVMRTNVIAFTGDMTQGQAAELIRPGKQPRGQWLFPVIDSERRLLGVVSRKHLSQVTTEDNRTLGSIPLKEPVVAYADEPLRAVVYRMVDSGFTRMPVMDAKNRDQLAGMISLEDLLRARARNLAEERERERVLRLRIPIAGRNRTEQIKAQVG
jgi:CBS domain-containing protein